MKAHILFGFILILTCFAKNAIAQIQTTALKQNESSSISISYSRITLSAVLAFAANQSRLSAIDQKKISDMVKMAKTMGRIAKIEVAVWSDKELALKGDLPKADRDLALERAKYIKEIINELTGQINYIIVFNMAEGSNWLTSMLHKSKVELGYMVRGKSVVNLEELEIFKREGARSKAVVIMKVKEYGAGQPPAPLL
ncbi:MAG: hypothetical protein PHY93_18835 [Bacteriovorax sp.]|nr:hypothetical protein [Bacteriovorax sp.]